MTIKRKMIHIDEERCDGCGRCIPSCAEGALKIVIDTRHGSTLLSGAAGDGSKRDGAGR